ncbi:DUF6492 family protein [Arthrobacter sp. PM3]|uniref:DUF6492 family protein n=1 Tax=Arthrobacter sp. PM3 TaxID=2017685 RepID=UPI000E10E4BD|nr:DUF6492 family protein [Arthrobacter sp. PM3]AXJ09815.1 hypothetical protein CFN17_09420 [Arthrobacter sp. PM3]
MHLEPSDVDLVTVTFEGDARLAVLQIISVDRLLDHENIGRYIVVLNGQDNAAVEAFLRSNVETRISSELAAKIEYVPAIDLLPDNDPQGWHGQQLLKLVVAANLASRYYLVLDAKNHFIHRTLVSDFFTETAIKTIRRPASKAQRALIEASFGLFGAADRASGLSGAAMPTITPYLMDTGTVREMMSDLESRHAGTAFGDILEVELSTATEFYLYWAYLVVTGKEGLYEHSDKMAVTLFTKYPRRSSEFLALLESARADRVAMFGLHRRRLRRLTGAQRDLIVELWGTELLTADEDAEWFMEYENPMSA